MPKTKSLMLYEQLKKEILGMEYGLQQAISEQEIAMRCVFTHPLWDQLDKGTVTEKEALQEFIKADPAQEALIREIAGRTKETLFPLSYADDWVKSLKAQGYPVYILSNYAGELYEKTKHLMTK